jgi:hypothetical protein
VQQRQANGQLGPEGSLKWLDGEPVEQWQLRRLVGLPSVWTVHDLIWNQQVHGLHQCSFWSAYHFALFLKEEDRTAQLKPSLGSELC